MKPTALRCLILTTSGLLVASLGQAAIINPDYNGNFTGWSGIHGGGGFGYDGGQNAPGSVGGSAFSDEAIYQKLTDLASATVDHYDLSAYVYNDRNSLGGNTASTNPSDPPNADTQGLPLHLRLYTADAGETPATAFLLGSLSIGTAGNPLPNNLTWGQFTLTVSAATIPVGELNKALLVSLETNNLTQDSWVYADRWSLTAVPLPEPSSCMLFAAAIVAYPFLRRRVFAAARNSSKAIGLAILLGWTASASAVPILEYKFNETGTSAPSTGSDSTAVTMRTSGGAASDFHGTAGSGVSGGPSDRAFDVTSSTSMGDPGTGPYANQADNNSVDGLTSLTLQCWYKPAASLNPVNGARLFSNWDSSQGFDVNNGVGNGWTLYIDGNFGINSTGSFTDSDIGNWIFFAVTYDSVAAEAKFYKGTTSSSVVPLNTVATAQGATDDNGVGLVLSNFSNVGITRPFDGLLDNMRIFGSAIDSSGALDITALEALRQADLIPEPGSAVLLATGMLICVGKFRRRRTQSREISLANG